MSLENAEEQLRKSREVERSRESKESKESKESEMSAEDKAAATMERADFLVKEVKSGKQQIQNIVIHMQQVMQTIQALRKQLQIQSDDTTGSVEQDKKQVENLKKKIAEHKDEILKMKDELIKAQVDQIKKDEGATLSDQQMQEQAEEMVSRIMEEVEK
ncbi:hypothetical protein HN481_02785 [Candidatus Parcubacteria bacterium]|jgi:hypothetical protein|nr:hypothetical protein [Candidatus Parcubacteria bacterium]